MASDPSPPGQPESVRVGKYEIVCYIATGGMGAVYRARDPETGRDIALKVLTPEMAAKPAMLERFRREARNAAKLHHENIVRIYEFDEYKGTHYIAMEFVDGVDLLEHIEEHAPLDPEETRQIMIQACRALKHANDQGIVHRDIKPSNLLLTKKNGRTIVKLTDLGLAREVSNDEFRITRSGTTVGTVDYLSPEQARDSGTADIRSDLYSLGCTWFHMLAGQTPFAEGSLAVRILAHMQEPVPDVRAFNARASKALVKVLNKLLEKDATDRYQTPGELIEVLHSLDPISKSIRTQTPRSLQVAAEHDGASPVSLTRRTTSKGKGKGLRRGAGDTIADQGITVETRSPRRKILWLGALGTIGVLLLGIVGLIIAMKSSRGPTGEPGPESSGSEDNHVLVTQPGPEIKPNPEIKPLPIENSAQLPRLFEPRAPIKLAELRERIDKAFPRIESEKQEPPLHLKRTATGEDGVTFATLGDAVASVPPGRPIVLEIQDNGPLFWSTTSLSGRDVTLCAARGYRPLIVWDLQRTLQEQKEFLKPEKEKPLSFLAIAGGRLHLEDVDVVAQWPANLTKPLNLIQITDADFSAHNCTFSLSGKHASPVTIAHVVALESESHRCSFTRCVLRGNNLQALDLDASGGQVLFENCLIAGAEFPLFQVRCASQEPATLSVVRSTLVAGNSLLAIQSAQPNESSPALNWFSWDSILSRSSEKIGGEMIILPPNADAAKIQWEAVNTLYAGWQTLLTGAEPIRYDALARWRSVLKGTEGDRALVEAWPSVPPDCAEVGAAHFKPAKSPVAFAATVNPEEPIGCLVEQLPTLRDNWKALAYYEADNKPSFNLLDVALAPEIPPSDGQLYTGEVLELKPDVDLGLILRDLQRTRRFGPKVVLHLKGAGVQKMTPFKLKGVHLTLHFEQPATDEVQRLLLTLPVYKIGATLPAAMIEIEEGGLDVINGTFSLPDRVGAPVTATLFKVSGGDLRLFRCRLNGPYLYPPPANYRGLIQFDGSGQVAADQARQCVINESVLVTDRTALDVRGLGVRLLLKQSVAVSGGQVLHVELGPLFKGSANMRCLFDSASVAARRSVVLLDDTAATDGVQEPLVLQSSRTAFLYPFGEKNNLGGLVRYSGDALARGLLLWQSEGDLWDARYRFGYQATAVDPSQMMPGWQTEWKTLWGSSALQRPKLDAVLRRQFDPGKLWKLDQLLLSEPNTVPSENKPLFGADLVGNGFVKKIKRP